MMKIIELPDGYNGHTVTCDTEPIETDGDMLKLAVVDNSLRYRPYLVRWIHRDDLEDIETRYKAFRGLSQLLATQEKQS